MTEKELLYLEDAYEHECITLDTLNTMMDNTTNDEILSFIEDEINKHKLIKKSVIRLMESEANEW